MSTDLPPIGSRVAVKVDAADCSTAYCAGANGWSGPEYPICGGCNADGTRLGYVGDVDEYTREHVKVRWFDMDGGLTGNGRWVTADEIEEVLPDASDGD
jgi:hypothetical protein